MSIKENETEKGKGIFENIDKVIEEEAARIREEYRIAGKKILYDESISLARLHLEEKIWHSKNDGR
jgi:hypothetical protein